MKKNILADIVEVTFYNPHNLKTAVRLSLIGVALCIIVKKLKK